MSAISPRVLVVAGDDPSGGAGLAADREAARASGATIVEVVTAFTDQDAERVRAVGARDPAAWSAEALARLDGARALKFGLLPGADHVRAAARLARIARANDAGLAIVVDPIVRSTSGTTFLDEEGIRALRDELLARGVICTPNLPELAALAALEERVLERDLSARERAARALLARGAQAVVVTGGHGVEDPLVNLLVDVAGVVAVTAPRLPAAVGGRRALRGTGCRFATALACALARGDALPTAVEAATAHVGAALRMALAAPRP